MKPNFLERMEDKLEKSEALAKLSKDPDFLVFLKELKEIRDEVKIELFDNRKRASDIPHVRLVEDMTIWKTLDRVIHITLDLRENKRKAKRRSHEA